MINLTDDDLFFRLGNTEDALTERKTTGDSKDWLKTIVAFANSAPIGIPCVLFIGVKDDGTIEDKEINWDSLQKTLGEKLSFAYPPILYVTKVLRSNGNQFLAIIVEGNADRPDFAGPSYIREGSVTKVASKEQFQRLIDERSAKVYEILRWKNKLVTVDRMNVDNIFIMGAVQSTEPAKVLDCNQFYVTWESRNFRMAVPLARVELSFDQKEQRLKLEVRPI